MQLIWDQRFWQKKSKKMGIDSPDGILVRTNEADKLDLPYLLKNIKWKNNSIAELIIHPSVTPDCEYFGGITEGRVKEYKTFHANGNHKKAVVVIF